MNGHIQHTQPTGSAAWKMASILAGIILMIGVFVPVGASASDNDAMMPMGDTFTYEVKGASAPYGAGVYITGLADGYSQTTAAIPATLGGQPVVSAIIDGSSLVSLDASAATGLVYLESSNSTTLTSLVVGGGDTALKHLVCYLDSSLSTLDVSGCTVLETLFCGNDHLSTLDISANPALTELYCANNCIQDTSALETWLGVEGHSGQVTPQNSAVTLQGATGYDETTRTLTYEHASVVLSSGSGFSVARMPDDRYELAAASGSQVTLSLTPATGYILAFVQIDGANQPIIDVGGSYRCTLTVPDGNAQIDVTFDEGSSVGLTMEGADATVGNGVFTFTDPAPEPDVLMGTMTVDYGNGIHYAGASNVIDVPTGSHVTLTASATVGYVPTISGAGDYIGFHPNEDGTAYECSFDIAAPMTVTVGFHALPRLDITSGAGATVDTTTTAGAFTFKSTDAGTPILATMTVSDGMIPYAPAMPIYLTGTHVELRFADVMADYNIVVGTDNGTAVSTNPENPGTYYLDVTGDTTVTVTFTKGETLTLPAAYDEAYRNSYGTVEWATSDDEDATWNPITSGTILTTSAMFDPQTSETITFYNYTFLSGQTVYIKATWPTGNPSGWTAMEGIDAFDGGTIDNGKAKRLIGSGVLQYDDWYTINWAYDSAHSLGPDDIVTNGKIVITGVSGGVDESRNLIGSDGSGEEGLAFLSSGATVTIRFVPDVGYQFTGVKVNGERVEGITASNETYTYTFTANAQMHFSSSFEKVDDIVINSATNVASVSLGNGSNAVTAGNAQLVVSNDSPASGIVVQMQAAAGEDATLQDILGLVLNQVVSKTGDTFDPTAVSSDTAWIEQKTEFDEPVTVSVVLAEGVVPDGATVSVIRNHVNGDGTNTVTKIDCAYDTVTRALTFTSNLFSDFAIATTPQSSIFIYEIMDASAPYGAGAYITGLVDGYSQTTAAIPATLDGQPVVSAIIDGSSLVSLDASAATGLVYLESNNSTTLTSLVVGDNTALKHLVCYFDSALATLDVSGCTELADLNCNFCRLTSLILASGPDSTLKSLDCMGNQLTVLDVSGHSGLTELNCSVNRITALDVSGNTALETLVCYANDIADRAVLNILVDRYGSDDDVILPQNGVVYWSRLAGKTRYDTAALIAQQGFEDDSSDDVILARGDDFPDALAAASLAGALGCPVITTLGSALDPSAFSEIDRLGASKVYILGGTRSISEATETAVRNIEGVSTVERIEGISRVDTAIRIAAKTRAYGSDSDTCIITKGWAYADALAMAPYAYASGSPIFLANKDGSISPMVVHAIHEGGYLNAIVLGGEDGISDDSMDVLESSTSVTGWIRLAGADRYATAELIATWACGGTTEQQYAIQPSEGAKLSYDKMAVARGDDFPDALASVSMLGPNKAALLLVKSDATDPVTHERIIRVIGENSSGMHKGYILGGTGSVNATIEQWVNDES